MVLMIYELSALLLFIVEQRKKKIPKLIYFIGSGSK